MIGYLIVTRAAIVLWVNLAGMPVVPVFGLPEGREERTLSVQILPDLGPLPISYELCSCAGC
jgi:hypothetical protein